MVKNEMAKYIADIKPHSDRILEVTLNSRAETTLLYIYAPQSHRPEEEKDQFYTQLSSIISKTNKKGPLIVMGDFNARLQEPDDEEEQ